MRVSRTQAKKNRQNVIDVASRLFREHGFDGIGLKDVMASAGLTQGAFYKQFASKDDLAAQASERALESALARWSSAAAANPQSPLGAIIAFYLSMEHSTERMDGCPVVALGSDAARQGVGVMDAFEAGIREYIDFISPMTGEAGDDEPSSKAMAVLSTMVGAVLLSRAVNDDKLSRQILQAAADGVMKLSAHDVQDGPVR